MNNIMKDKMFNFEDLRLYVKALDFIDYVYQTTSDYPQEAGELAMNYRRASEGIALNIAEGSGENKLQFIRFLRISKGLVRECLVYSTIAYRRNIISDMTESDSRDKLIELAKMLGGLISSLQRKAKGYDARPNEQETEQI